LTVALVATLPAAAVFGMFMYVIWFPVIAIVGLRGIWAKGWVVPGARTPGTAVVPPSPDGWLWDRGEIVRNALLAASLLAGVATLLYVQSAVVRFVVIVTGVVAGATACLRWVRGDR
jgi:hypothetical protein